MKTTTGRSIIKLIQTHIQLNDRGRNMDDIWEVNMQWWEQLNRGLEKGDFFKIYYHMPIEQPGIALFH